METKQPKIKYIADIIVQNREGNLFYYKSFPLSAKIVIPSICCMEALSTLEHELKYRKRFSEELELQIT